MLRKRLVGVITVKDGWAVQSMGYRRYLPLGRPEILAQNLDRWGADEILLQVIDRSAAALGPDMALLERVAREGISTPLIYAGGIRSAQEAVDVVAAGADRVAVDALLDEQPAEVVRIEEKLGAQAVIASLPMSIEKDGVCRLDYRTGAARRFGAGLLDLLESGIVSEALVIDWKNEGRPGGFDFRLADRFPVPEVPLIVFGGLSEGWQLRSAFERDRVVAAGIGNFLAYREHAIRQYKLALGDLPLRAPAFPDMSAR